ncbi:MAG: hypothetical protein FWD35_06890 [Oscillospiraceae bacterium]|nr:hypothetical protein [Oscillospiraceae bacterium]
MREVLLNICLISVALSLFKMLLPETAAKKQVHFLLACFFLSALVTLFTNGRADLAGGLDAGAFKLEEIPYVDFAQELEAAQINAVSREAARETRYRVAEVLAKQNIFPQQIIASVNISDDHSISISEVRLVYPNLDLFEEMTAAVHITQKEVGDKVLVSGMLLEE